MHPDFYKRPLLFFLIALILGLLFFYKPGPASQDVHAFIPSKDITLIGRVEKFYTVKPKSNNVIVKVIFDTEKDPKDSRKLRAVNVSVA